MKQWLLILLSLALFWGAEAQEKRVQTIRREYYQLKKEITACEKKGYNGPLYCLRLTDNPYRAIYPAVGNFLSTISFYYDHSPEGKRRLRMVIESTERSIGKEYIEVMYRQDGSVAFTFQECRYGGVVDSTDRLYLEDGNVLLHLTDGPHEMVSGDIHPHSYQERFKLLSQ